MKKRLILAFFLLLGLCPITAQSPTDSIEVKKAWGTVFKQNGQLLTPRKLLDITSSHPEAYKEMKVAKSNYDIGSVIGFVGGFLVGYPLGTALAGGEANWTLAGIGAGLIGVSIPFTSAYTKHAKIAVQHYNEGIQQSGMNPANLKIGLTGSGLCLRMTF
jgi:hypothetical protein